MIWRRTMRAPQEVFVDFAKKLLGNRIITG